MDKLQISYSHTQENEKEVYNLRKKNHFWRPTKTTTIAPNGTVTIDHKYANGLNVIKEKTKHGDYKVISITHDKLLHPLYQDQSIRTPNYHGMVFSEEALKIYGSLPTTLKNVCAKDIREFSKKLLSILGGFRASDYRTTNKTYYLDKNTPVTIIETTTRTNDEYAPKKTTIIHSNGTIIINRRYKDGLYVIKSKQNENATFEIESVSKQGHYFYSKFIEPKNKLLLNDIDAREFVNLYMALPSVLQKKCYEYVKAVIRNFNIKL